MAESSIKVTPTTTEEIAGYKFNAKQNLAIELLARGMTWAEVSEQVDVNPSTISRWMKLPGFSDSIDFFRHSVVAKRLKEFDGKMGQFEFDAIEMLHNIVMDENAKVQDRIQAAGKILSHQNSRKQLADNQVMVSFSGMPVIGKAEGNILTGEVSNK